MKTIYHMKGIPASGKSFYAKELMRKEPNQWKRINFDDLRASIDGGVYSPANEKIIIKMRDMLIVAALKNDQNVVVDNTHIKDKGRHFDHICKLVKGLNIDVQIIEKPIYCEIEVAIERDANRENPVGKDVIEQFWKASGGKQFRFYEGKKEVYTKRDRAADTIIEPMKQDEGKPKAIICDLDGTYCTIGDRSPYSAHNCDEVDFPNYHIIEIVKMYYDAGHEIIFCSGREEKDREPTMRFINKHSPNMTYKLLMRKTDDKRSDDVVKEEIFNAEIKDRYWVKLVIDDRLRVCRLWFRLGLNLLRAGDPDADF